MACRSLYRDCNKGPEAKNGIRRSISGPRRASCRARSHWPNLRAWIHPSFLCQSHRQRHPPRSGPVRNIPRQIPLRPALRHFPLFPGDRPRRAETRPPPPHPLRFHTLAAGCHYRRVEPAGTRQLALSRRRSAHPAHAPPRPADRQPDQPVFRQRLSRQPGSFRDRGAVGPVPALCRRFRAVSRRSRRVDKLAARRLSLHPRKTVVLATGTPVPFLGYDLHPDKRALPWASVRRFRNRLRGMRDRYRAGTIDPETIGPRIRA